MSLRQLQFTEEEEVEHDRFLGAGGNRSGEVVELSQEELRDGRGYTADQGLGFAQCDSGGFVTNNTFVPAGMVSSGDVVEITSGRIDASGGVVVLAPPVEVIFGP